MIALKIISLILAVGGMVLMSRGGVPDSVSGMVYSLPVRRRWLWSVWMIAVALTLMVPLMTSLGDVAWLGWLTVVCLIGAAVTPVFNRDTRTMHHVYGIAAGVLSQVCVACLCPWWLLCWFIYVPLIAGSMAAFNDSEEMPVVCDGKGVLVSECICAISLYGSLLCC